METKMSTIAIERSATAAEITSRARVGRKQLALAGLAVAITLGGIGYGRYWWETERFIASTDDAYASGNVTAVSPHVAGFVAEILVGDNQPVQAGQLLIRLDARDYHAALDHARAVAEERQAALTGLDPDYLDRVDLRVEHVRFFTELLRSRRRTVGRLDGRFLGWDTDYGRERWTADPSYDAILGPYTAAINHYLRVELRYASDLPYESMTDQVTPWSMKEFEGRHANVADRLGQALRANPHLRVYVAAGYYDGAAPYFAAEHAFAHLSIPPELRGNIEFRYFEAGHMMYVHEPSRLAQSAQLAEFVSVARG